jgi:tRNA pseudouridine55 synthase
MNGVLVVDKPRGPTSHDVVDRVRKALGVRRVGHTGTLDPVATGVLAACVGKATRLARFLGEGDKVYRATVRLGFATTTDDLMGEPAGPVRAVRIEWAAVRQACARLTGPILQVPPAYSAKRVSGRRMYDLARQGVEVPRGAVPVTVHSLEILGLAADCAELEVVCSPGTYVRALARDLGAALGVGGHLTALRRLRSGEFDLSRAVSWDELPRLGWARLIPLAELLTALPAVRVGREGVEALRHGRDIGGRLALAGFPDAPAGRVRLLDEGGELLALAVPRGFESAPAPLAVEPVLHPDVVLAD